MDSEIEEHNAWRLQRTTTFAQSQYGVETNEQYLMLNYDWGVKEGLRRAYEGIIGRFKDEATYSFINGDDVRANALRSALQLIEQIQKEVVG